MAGTRGVPRSDEVIRGFFDEQRRATTGRRRERLDRAEADLRACLEAHAERLLTAPELALLALERQFEAAGAVARTAAADAVLLLLPIFLEDHHWFGEDLEDRRLRIRLAEPLAYAIARRPELPSAAVAPAVWTVEAATEHAVWMLRQEREAARRG
jgi:hypothetical protein